MPSTSPPHRLEPFGVSFTTSNGNFDVYTTPISTATGQIDLMIYDAAGTTPAKLSRAGSAVRCVALDFSREFYGEASHFRRDG